MKKVLFLIDKFHYSGAAKAMQLVSNGLAETGEFRIAIAAFIESKPAYDVNDSIEILVGPKRSSNKVLKYFSPIFVVRDFIKKEKPDCVVAFLNNASFYVLMARLGLKSKVIVCERCDPYNEVTKSLSFMRRFFPLADGAVFQLKGAQQYYKKLLNKSVVIPNIVELENLEIPAKKFAERENEINVFTRLEIKQKRQDVLLKAFQIIHGSHPEVTLNIYGDGPDRTELEKLAAELKLTESVKFKGVTKEANKILSRSKMTILTSDYEGIPNGVIEALAIGIPVVSTNTSPGGAELLIENGVNGYIVPTGDYEGIAQAAIKLLDNPDIADMFSDNSVESVKRFTKEKIVPLWKDYLNKF
ncbi:glycosyltransferase [Streptococcus alactolyticus]|uniref:glycosyltransferase n=1 Tax=Streptococcus alactolyticus TaxID=29389 RepID=UPI003F980361